MIIPEEIATIIRNLKTQDARATAHPAYCVERQEMRTGLDTDYADDGEIAWIHDGELWNRDDWPALNKAHWHGEEVIQLGGDKYLMTEFDRTGFRIEWFTVQTFLTMAGAEAFMQANAHNLRRFGEPRIYVESFHRNHEMIALRDWLMSLEPTTKETP